VYEHDFTKWKLGGKYLRRVSSVGRDLRSTWVLPFATYLCRRYLYRYVDDILCR